MPKTTLDPDDWPAMRAAAHGLLDAAFDRLQNTADGRVWTPLPDELKDQLRDPIPRTGVAPDKIADRLAALLPYGVGNTHSLAGCTGLAMLAASCPKLSRQR